MHSLLANANYEYKEMKLADLRDRIVKENQLTSIDILKGFHTKSRIHPTYDIPQTDEDNKVIFEIHKAILEYVNTNSTRIAQQKYDELFSKLFEELRAVEPNATIEKINNGEYAHHKIGDPNSRYTTAVYNAVFNLQHTLNYNHDIEEAVTKDLYNFVENWLIEHYPNYTISKKKYNTLPSYVELNTDNNINFDEVYTKLDSPFGNIFGGLDTVTVTFTSYLRLIQSCFNVHIDYIYRHLSKEEVKTVFNNAIDDVIYNNNKMDLLAYFQNLEAQPITINLNTKTGRCELIDGYKRLLYVADKEMLQYSAPVRVFTDLDDISFMSLLYAANLWKYSTKSSGTVFHDRGYLFALKTRYGFEIPKTAYGHFVNNQYYPNILKVFYIYDFDDEYYPHKFGDTQLSIMNSLRHHKHTIKDLYIILNELPLESSKNLKYDQNIIDEIENFIIRTIGHIRKLPNSDEQKDLTVDTLTKIFNDELIIKACAKKHLSSSTYVKNHLMNKNIYNRIIEILINDLK